MEFLETHWVEFLVGFLVLWISIKAGNLTTFKDKDEIAVAGLVGEEGWSSFQEITVMRQISIDTTLQRIEYGIGAIVVLLIAVVF